MSLTSILRSPIPSPREMSRKLSWYWHRLRVMGLREIGGHLRNKCFAVVDSRWARNWSAAPLEASFLFPKLPDRAAAPAVLLEGLRHDVSAILDGRWLAFEHVELKVDDPPHWQMDYLVGHNLATRKPAFKLNRRVLPGGADIKLFWELSRWHPLVRLAQAAWLLGDAEAGRKCVRWLADWEVHNKPYHGWNWTSALESGLRLIQFVWMDALLAEMASVSGYTAELERLRYQLLPAHVRFTWRYRSFGSSANNHWLGELAGLIVALTRWPVLARWGAPLPKLHRLWEKEVLSQFAEDGGNREQALHYHLFSWEFCAQTRLALQAAGRSISVAVEERLQRAADFFHEVQMDNDVWYYGDSDDAFVTPFFANRQSAMREWHQWFRDPESSPAIQFWLGPAVAGEFKPDHKPSTAGGTTPGCAERNGWRIFSVSGLAIRRSGDWTLRWDLSPLGYLTTAAHGHCDALHLSVWFKGLAFVIDPGTGAYYPEPDLRAYLASWAAHNGPALSGIGFPKRLGPFLWSKHHDKPSWQAEPIQALTGELILPMGRVQRRVTELSEGQGWEVADSCAALQSGDTRPFDVRWQFAPGSMLEVLSERSFRVSRDGVTIWIKADENWVAVEPHAVADSEGPRLKESVQARPYPSGICSPGYRKICYAPYLMLRAHCHNPCVFRTVFLASGSS